jgi:2-hydroxychromene-2-carboxylate isomerase
MRGSGTNRWTYIVRDTERIAERLELPFAWPKPDPVAVDMATLSVNDDQPHIFRLTHLGVEAGRRGLGLEFTAAVARLIFGGTRDWHEGAHLRDAVATVGLDLDELDRCIARDPDGYAGEVRANEAALEAAGHWGVPTLVLDNEPFFGQDRIEDFRWRLEQRGVRPR